MPYNTLINRLLLVTIYISEVCIPLLCIPKYPTTSLNLHQPTSMLIFFSFWYFNGEICYYASKHTHAICWVRGRQFLRTIKFSSGSSARESHSPPVVKRKKFCSCCSLSITGLTSCYRVSYISLISITSLPSHFHSLFLWLLFGPDHPSKCHLIRGISKTRPGRHHLLRRAIQVIC